MAGGRLGSVSKEEVAMEAKMSSTTTESNTRPAGVSVSSTMRLIFMSLVATNGV